MPRPIDLAKVPASSFENFDTPVEHDLTEERRIVVKDLVGARELLQGALVLVRIDDEERLLILGEGRELIEPRGPVVKS